MSHAVNPMLEQTIDIDLEAVRRRLDFPRFERLLRITPREYGELEHAERRYLKRAAEGFRDRFAEIANFMAANAPPPEPTPWPLSTTAQVNS